MIVLDTHAWLWWVTGSKKLSGKALRALGRASSIGVCAISCWEVAMLVQKGRLRLDRGVNTWVGQALATASLQLLPLDPPVAVAAAGLCAFGGDPADHMIVATTQLHNAQLVTADARIQESGLVRVLW